MNQITLSNNKKILVPSNGFNAGQTGSLYAIVYMSNVITGYLITLVACSFLNTPINSIIIRTCQPNKIIFVLALSSFGSGLVNYEVSTFMVRMFKEENMQTFKERNPGKIFLRDDGNLEEIPINFKRKKVFYKMLMPPKKIRLSFLMSVLFGNKLGLSFLVCLFVKDRFMKTQAQKRIKFSN